MRTFTTMRVHSINKKQEQKLNVETNKKRGNRKIKHKRTQ
jgi:hypothetical protein